MWFSFIRPASPARSRPHRPVRAASRPSRRAGTSLPFTATARPRPAGMSLFAAISSATVRATRGSGSPLMRMVVICHSAAMAGVEAIEPERRDQRIGAPVEDQSRDGLRGDRREQDAVAVVSRRIDQALDRAGAQDRGVVAAARAEADPGFGDRKLLDAGERAPGGIEQCELRAGGQMRVEAFLLHGRADEQPSVMARHQIDVRRPDDMAQQRPLGVHAQRQHLALDRPDRRARLRRQALDRTRPGARGQHHDIGAVQLARDHHADGAAMLDRDAVDRRMRADDRARALGRDAQAPRRPCGCRPDDPAG